MPDNKNNLLAQYGGFAFQCALFIGIAVFVGIGLDNKLKNSKPIFIWLLPVIILIGLLIRVIKNTSHKK